MLLVKIILAGVIVIASCKQSAAEDSGSFKFPYPLNRLGWADASGRLSIWVNGGWEVGIGDGEKLPLRFHFSSMQDRVGEGILGAGWWFPLLESTVVRVSEGVIRMTSLGGESIYLYAIAGKGGFYQSKNARWEAALDGHGGFEVTGIGGWTYWYRDGRIQKVKSPLGKNLRWSYSLENGAESILDDDGQALISVRYGDIGNGSREQLNRRLLREISVSDNPRISVAYGDFPIVSLLNGGVADLVPTARIFEVEKDGVKKRVGLDVELAEGNLYGLNYNSDFENSKKEENFIWGVDGQLLSDSVSAYRVERTGSGASKLLRNFTSGRRESYLWDPKSFCEERVDLTGGRRLKYRIATTGPAYCMVQKTISFDSLGKKSSEVTYSRNAEGELLRTMIRVGETVSDFQSGGEPSGLLSITREAKGYYVKVTTKNGAIKTSHFNEGILQDN